MNPSPVSRGVALSILASAPAETLKAFAEDFLDDLGAIQVLSNRTGLVVLPATDSAQGAQFHLGEVLVSEALIQLSDGTQAYGMCLGRDLVQALGLAVCDAMLAQSPHHPRLNAFIQTEAQRQAALQEQRLRQVQSTRVEMETF